MKLNKIEEEVIKLIRQGADIEIWMSNLESNADAREKVTGLATALNAKPKHVKYFDKSSSWKVESIGGTAISLTAFIKDHHFDRG